jgi:hypothetical protein
MRPDRGAHVRCGARTFNLLLTSPYKLTLTTVARRWPCVLTVPGPYALAYGASAGVRVALPPPQCVASAAALCPAARERRPKRPLQPSQVAQRAPLSPPTATTRRLRSVSALPRPLSPSPGSPASYRRAPHASHRCATVSVLARTACVGIYYQRGDRGGAGSPEWLRGWSGRGLDPAWWCLWGGPCVVAGSRHMHMHARLSHSFGPYLACAN